MWVGFIFQNSSKKETDGQILLQFCVISMISTLGGFWVKIFCVIKIAISFYLNEGKNACPFDMQERCTRS